MLAAIDLNHKPRTEAGEVREVRTDGNLAAKSIPIHLFSSQSPPEPDFRICLLGA